MKEREGRREREREKERERGGGRDRERMRKGRKSPTINNKFTTWISVTYTSLSTH